MASELAAQLVGQRDVEAALSRLEPIAQRHPDDGPTAAILAQVYARLGDQDRRVAPPSSRVAGPTRCPCAIRSVARR